MYSPHLFAQDIILITGARSGIGYNTAELFLHYGATVIICYRNEELLLAAADTLQKNSNGTLYAQTCDIREPEQAEALAAFIKKKCSRLDILINNAGGQYPSLA